ncbi:MAG: hypothetical protein ACFFAJ_03235 [Candidatus Hodarchaeota archaeon]
MPNLENKANVTDKQLPTIMMSSENTTFEGVKNSYLQKKKIFAAISDTI